MLALHENALLDALKNHRDVQRLVRTIDTLPRLVGEKLLTKYHADAPALYIVPGRFTVKDDDAVMEFTVAGVVRNVAGHAQARKGDGIDLGCDHLMTLATRALNRQVLGQCSWFLVSGEMADDEVFDIAGISAIEMRFVSSAVALDADYGQEQLEELTDFEYIDGQVPEHDADLPNEDNIRFETIVDGVRTGGELIEISYVGETGPAQIAPPPPPLPPAYAIGGTVSYDGPYTVHVIAATEDIQVFGTLTADVLLVGSGGGAGKGNASGALGGGGGAGRFLPLTNIVIEAGVYLAVIGSPGIASNDHINERATAGGATSFLGYIAPGGGCGGNGLGGSSGGTSAFTTGGSGGSSGGNGNRPEAEPAADTIPGTGEAGYGSKGAIRGLDGSAGSGGGAGSIGTSGDTAAGGLGLFSEITGVSLEYARGGDAGSYNGSTTDAPQGRGWGGNSGGAIGGPSKNGSTGSVTLRYLT